MFDNFQQVQEELSQINLVQVFWHKAHRGNRCIYCNLEFNKRERKFWKTKDHLIPKVRLSEASIAFKSMFYTSLLVPSCARCNTLKGSKNLEDFKDFLMNNWVANRIVILQHLKRLTV